MKPSIFSFMPLWLGVAYAQDANCDFFQNVQLGQTYYVYSPNYPRNYQPGVQCRWIATCPTGYNCRLDCSDINIPPSDSCKQDRLLVSKSGDPQLAGADTYCGRGTLSAVSTGNTISVGLISSYNSAGGRFNCQLRAQAASPQPDNCRCGYKHQNRIVGGQETGINEFPMMAGIVDLSIRQIKCGGVIIDKRYILTAGHCLLRKSSTDIAIVVGEHDVTIGDSPATQAFRVDSLLIHPQFTQANYDYDIGIVRVATDISFNDRVGPACLPFKFTATNLTGATVTGLGWGTLFPGGPTSDTLQKVNLQIISQVSCQNSVSSLTPRQVCTYTEGKDACQDDSGGPLMYQDPSTGLLFNLGIISYGRSCASGSPGINTRVTSLLTWILSNTSDASYCRK